MKNKDQQQYLGDGFKFIKNTKVFKYSNIYNSLRILKIDKCSARKSEKNVYRQIYNIFGRCLYRTKNENFKSKTGSCQSVDTGFSQCKICPSFSKIFNGDYRTQTRLLCGFFKTAHPWTAFTNEHSRVDDTFSEDGRRGQL